MFKEEDYNSNDGMITKVWGPPLWFSLHTISFNYPVFPTKEQKQEYYAYFMSLQWTLPCKYCRENYVKNLKVLPLDTKALSNRGSLSKWLYDLHNLVNKNLGKENYKTYEEVRDFYENFRSRCSAKKEDSKIEKGCVVPLHETVEKPQTILNVVPQSCKDIPTFTISKKCKN